MTNIRKDYGTCGFNDAGSSDAIINDLKLPVSDEIVEVIEVRQQCPLLPSYIRHSLC